MSDKERKKDYDDEPVYYCANCYSLKIGYEEQFNADCCMECGCSNILQTNIENWERLYQNRYGQKFVVKNTDPKRSLIYKMPLDKLKTMVCDNPEWRSIIHNIYPRFPKGYSKADSIIMFFDKISRDNRIDDLRLLLTNLKK